jgi:uncharacterized protein YceK
MIRLMAVTLALCGCGSVCNHAASSERTANQKGMPCGQAPITEHDPNKCNTGLHSCSADDVTQIENYAHCLDNLLVCEPANNTSWGTQRLGCVLQPFGRISAACSNAIL